MDERTESMQRDLDYLRGNVDAILKSAIDKAVSEAKYEAQRVTNEAIKEMYRDFYKVAAQQRGPGHGGSTFALPPQEPPLLTDS